MFIPSLYFLFILSHLLIILHLVEGQNSTQYTCPKEFKCGIFSMSFPFTESNNPGCGLYLLDCQKPNPQIKLWGEEDSPDDWRDFMLTPTNEIEIKVPKDCVVFHNQYLPSNDNISITISPNLTSLLKCDSNSSEGEIAELIPHYGKFRDCAPDYGFTIYYNYSDDGILDYNGVSPPNCSIVQLALNNERFNPDGDIFNMLEDIFLKWSDKRTWPCYECFNTSQQCIVDQDNEIDYKVHCSNKVSAGKRKKLGLILELVILAGGITTILAIAIIVCFVRRKDIKYCLETKSDDYPRIENFLRNHGSVPKRFKYKEIKKITSSFKNKIGQGGFGSVFKGHLDGDKKLVAIKLLSISNGNGEEFVNEVASISTTSHVNVVKLLGFCFEHNKRALVYEYMPNGSLEKFIFGGDNHLGWPTLFKIAIGIARGLEYLHLFCATRMVHFDIKPHNVLLDQDFCPKISDFGLAKLCSENRSMLSLSGARGTIGYIAPEVVCKNFGGVSHKSDVYSYGMMILEMVGGRKNSDVGCANSSQMYFPHWIYDQLKRDQEIVLPSIMNDVEKESARKMIIVSLWCIQTDPSQRPTMSKVVEMLEGNLDMLPIPPRPYLFSSANSCVADSSSALNMSDGSYISEKNSIKVLN